MFNGLGHFIGIVLMMAGYGSDEVWCIEGKTWETDKRIVEMIVWARDYKRMIWSCTWWDLDVKGGAA